MLMTAFQSYEAECKRLLTQTDKRLTLPAYDYCIKSSHVFNLLDARGAISVAERTGYIARVRALARQCAERYIEERATMGHPLINRGTGSDGAKTSGIRSESCGPPLIRTAESTHEKDSETSSTRSSCEEGEARIRSGRLPSCCSRSASKNFPTSLSLPLWLAVKDSAEQMLTDRRLAFQAARTWNSTTALTLVVEGLAIQQTSMIKEAMGPSKAVAFDQAGQPTRAAIGFAAGQGVPVQDLQSSADSEEASISLR